jgi:replicative DNA helicase
VGFAKSPQPLKELHLGLSGSTVFLSSAGGSPLSTLPDISLDQGMPANVDAERAILGVILLDNHAYNEAAAILKADDFSLDSHRRIFQRMGELVDSARNADIVTLANELSKHKEIDAVGGVAYLAGLTEGLPRKLIIDEYVEIVKDKSISRQTMSLLGTGLAQAAEQSEDAITIISDLSTKLLELSEKGSTTSFSSISDVVKGSFGTIENLYLQSREVTGVETYYTDFDKKTSGLQKSELIIIAARPSMGKTAWAINIAQNTAIRGGKTVAIFSLEMSKESLLRRMLSSQAMVDQQKIQKGFLLKEDRVKLDLALEQLVESRMYIDDTAGISLAEMRAKSRRLKQTQGLDLIVVDYLQLMSAGSMGGSKKGYENRTQEVSAISRGLKALAKELEVPVIALSQLSRASERRGDDKKPMLSDLRESGSIEQDADVVTFIHRESYYRKDENGEEDPEYKGKAEIIIAKQRNGPTGSVHLAWLSECTRFENMAHSPDGPVAY